MERASRSSVCFGARMHEELTPRTKMLRRDMLVKQTVRPRAETAGSPGRDTSAGHMKLANVLVFVGMNPEVAYRGRDQIEKCVFNESEWLVLPVVQEATTPPKLTPKDVNCVDKKLGMEHRSHRDDGARELDGSGCAGPVPWRGAPRISGSSRSRGFPLNATMCSG